MQQSKPLIVTIIGSGYVGLTTGVALAYLGHKLSWVEKNKNIVAKLTAGWQSNYSRNRVSRALINT